MKIACLGWGSLIWDPRDLHLRGDPPVWHEDGPHLPVEFARKSSRDRITLVIIPHGLALPVLWSEMAVQNLDAARENLKIREGTGPIGFWPSPSSGFLHSDSIGTWAKDKGFDAVVWAALRPKFDSSPSVPTSDAILTHFRRLVDTHTESAAEQYVRRTPQQIRTPYRKIIEESLGWTYEPFLESEE